MHFLKNFYFTKRDYFYIFAFFLYIILKALISSQSFNNSEFLKHLISIPLLQMFLFRHVQTLYVLLLCRDFCKIKQDRVKQSENYKSVLKQPRLLFYGFPCVYTFLDVITAPKNH